MKSLLLILFSLLYLGKVISAQQLSTLPLPLTAYLPHYRLEVGYDRTTMLIFPAEILPGDKGISDRELMVQRQPKSNNILRVKAAKKNFTPTNLHVPCKDGHMYAFDVFYVEIPEYTTIDCSRINDKNITATEATTKVHIDGQVLNEDSLHQLFNAVRMAPPRFCVKAKKFDMKMILRNVHQAADLLIFSFDFVNRSNLDYPVDFARFFIRDQERIKRSSMQETEMIPIKQDPLITLKAHSTTRYLLATSRFTIPEKKECKLELYELNGGRHLSLLIKNKQLLQAIPLK